MVLQIRPALAKGFVLVVLALGSHAPGAAAKQDGTEIVVVDLDENNLISPTSVPDRVAAIAVAKAWRRHHPRLQALVLGHEQVGDAIAHIDVVRSEVSPDRLAGRFTVAVRLALLDRWATAMRHRVRQSAAKPPRTAGRTGASDHLVPPVVHSGPVLRADLGTPGSLSAYRDRIRSLRSHRLSILRRDGSVIEFRATLPSERPTSGDR